MTENKSDLFYFDAPRGLKMEPPDWVSESVFYGIFPDRFRNGDRSNDPGNVREWGEKPETDSFFGGDLAGIEEKLDYLKNLGVNALYLNPIFKSPSNHKYDITDYYRVDPAFGNESELKSLVSRAHDKGIRVILDGVFNHTGEEFPRFQDVKQKGSDSKYWDWYRADGFPLETDPEPNYDCWAGVPEMPELDRTNPEVREYLLNVVRYWIEETDVDGWRLDTVHDLEPEFVRAVRSAAKAVKDDAYVMGEVMGPAGSWFKSHSIDGVMNYELYDLIVDFIAHEEISARNFRRALYSLRRSYPDWANFANYNLLSSHDIPRLMTVCRNNVEKYKLAYFFLFTVPGAPAIYYGDEIGMEGGEDPDCRRTYPWNEARYHEELLDYFKQLIEIRKEFSALTKGDFRGVGANEKILAYLRTEASSRLLAVINAGSRSGKIEVSREDIPGCSNLKLLLGDASPKLNKDKFQVNIPGSGYCLLKLQQ